MDSHGRKHHKFYFCLFNKQLRTFVACVCTSRFYRTHKLPLLKHQTMRLNQNYQSSERYTQCIQRLFLGSKALVHETSSLWTKLILREVGHLSQKNRPAAMYTILLSIRSSCFLFIVSSALVKLLCIGQQLTLKTEPQILLVWASCVWD